MFEKGDNGGTREKKWLHGNGGKKRQHQQRKRHPKKAYECHGKCKEWKCMQKSATGYAEARMQ